MPAVASPATFTIDQLAAASGVPSRTIRLYQTKGVLPPPERRGRVSYYRPDHVARLRLIGELQGRGLQLSAIRELVEHCDGEVTVRQWLGLGDRLRKPSSEETPRMFTAADLATRLKDRRSGTLSALLRTGVLQRHGEGTSASYLAPSPGLLDAALALDDAGVDFDTSAAAAAILRRRLAQAVSEVVRLLVDRAGDGFGRDGTADGVATALEGVRVTGGDATRLIFASEVERAVNQLVARGAPAVRLSRERPS